MNSKMKFPSTMCAPLEALMKLESHGWAADFPEGVDCNTDLSEGSIVTNPYSHGMSHR